MCDFNNHINNINKSIETIGSGMSLVERVLCHLPIYAAHQQFIEDVKKNPELTDIQRYYLLRYWSKIKAEIENRVDIYEEAKKIYFNDEKQTNFEERLNSLGNEWFGIFDDIIKNVSDKEMQTVWAKILSNKCADNKSVSKKTILTLQTMESDIAETFSYFCANTLFYKDTEDDDDIGTPVFLYTEEDDVDEVFAKENDPEVKKINIYNSNYVNNVSLFTLSELGLIHIMPTFDRKGFGYKQMIITHYDKEILLKSSKGGIAFGSIIYTVCGTELVRALYDGVHSLKNDNLPQAVIDYYNSKGYEAKFI